MYAPSPWALYYVKLLTGLPQIKELMCPSQLGIAVPGGTEMINHIFECLLSDDPSLTALKTDFKNAFNMVSREYILDEIEELFP